MRLEEWRNEEVLQWVTRLRKIMTQKLGENGIHEYFKPLQRMNNLTTPYYNVYRALDKKDGTELLIKGTSRKFLEENPEFKDFCWKEIIKFRDSALEQKGER